MKTLYKAEEDNREKVAGNDFGADSLPVHCIIQTVSSMDDLKAKTCRHCDAKANTGAENWWECGCKNIEMSGCVVIPEDTSINDLVKTILEKLGYPSCASSFAAGAILIRNWKPLSLEEICPGMKETVGEMLRDLTAVVSLRIQIFRPQITVLQKIKDTLLNFLIEANRNFLQDSGCPFDLCTLSKLCDENNSRKHPFDEATGDWHEKFETWLRNYRQTEEPENDKNGLRSSFSQSSIPNSSKGNQNDNSGGSGSITQEIDIAKSESFANYSNEANEEKSLSCVKESSLFNVVKRPKHSAAPKARVRTSFDPEFELPKLHKWFFQNPHPNRQQICEYVAELNSLESRKGRKQLDINNVVYWFKNARAAQKRTEYRRFSSTPTSGVNRCNILKIPLGKTSGVTPDDQRSISDDEASITSESGEDNRNGNGRCLQVVGKWNSNGQGEAVLEMQIGGPKKELVEAVVKDKKGELKENEEASEDATQDNNQRNSVSEKKDSATELPERNGIQKENQSLNIRETNIGDIRNIEEKGNDQRHAAGNPKEDEVSPSKIQIKNSFTLYKENNHINDNAYLPPYKSGFSVPPTSILGHSFMCIPQFMNPKPNNLPLSSEERRKRNRTFIDPVTEVPRLEQWFRLSTHPSHNLIARYTDELNNMPYRRKFPKLETKSVQFWFKNRRAKNKRLNYLGASN